MLKITRYRYQGILVNSKLSFIGPSLKGPARKGPGHKNPGSKGPGSQGPGSKDPGIKGPASKDPCGKVPGIKGPGNNNNLSRKDPLNNPDIDSAKLSSKLQSQVIAINEIVNIN